MENLISVRINTQWFFYTISQLRSKMQVSKYVSAPSYIGLYLLVVSIILLFFVIKLWPIDTNYLPIDNKYLREQSIPNNAWTVQSKQNVDPDSKLTKQNETLNSVDIKNKGTVLPIKNVVDSDKYETKLYDLSIEDSLKNRSLLDSPNNVPEIHMILIAIILGALGSCLHAITSLTIYLGNQKYNRNWAPWYFFRPITGAILSLVVYVVVRAGFITHIENVEGFYIIAATACLVGLFSKQALDKLSDIFDILFQSKKKDRLKNNLIQD